MNPTMHPLAGDCVRKFVGDRVHFSIVADGAEGLPEGWQARLRTNLGRAAKLREEIIRAQTHKMPRAGASWRDLPMKRRQGEWTIDLATTEVGFFEAKAYLVDPAGRQYWPPGGNVGISVHPDAYRSGNVIYCAFPRMFGPTKSLASTSDEKLEQQLHSLDARGYTVIPPSGKLRDVIKELPHIIDTLGCRILHLLPVGPTPTTYARFGRFGSPYACQDLTAIDPALVEFDQRTTGVDQFRELAFAVHARGGRLFLDVIINHTGWGATLQETHPEWYQRGADGAFVSPGAWGTIWHDLVELEHKHVALWDHLVRMFLTWCRRGVDGFRCDAGYMVPVAAWQYIIAHVRNEFPNALFLLEGLGGAWEATEALLTRGGMQWAYSELFQNFSPVEVSGYLDHALKQSDRAGLLVHYGETHDNDRLAAKGRAWSLLRNRLCALTSVSGGFGFTCGVEWLAPEKIDVHSSRGLAWGNQDNLVAELATLNRLIANHPGFFEDSHLTRLSNPESEVYALLRESANGGQRVLVLVNTNVDESRSLRLDAKRLNPGGKLSSPKNGWPDLLGQEPPGRKPIDGDGLEFTLAPAAAHCLALTKQATAEEGTEYRHARARAAWAIEAVREVLTAAEIGLYEWRELAARVETDPAGFLGLLSSLDHTAALQNLGKAVESASESRRYPPVVRWELPDRRRITPVPPDHWLLVCDDSSFRAELQAADGLPARHVESIPVRDGYLACFPPRKTAGDATLRLERYAPENQHVEAAIRFLAAVPAFQQPVAPARENLPPDALVLLTNGIGGMARLCVDLGRVNSKYDCLLGANLHPSLPVDRHVFAKRARVWVNADGFINPLDARNLVSFTSGPPAVWVFLVNAGDGRKVEIRLTADMLEGRNTTVLHFARMPASTLAGKPLPDGSDVRLTVRVDIEDRGFHTETHHTGGADHHFNSNTRPLKKGVGFEFTPAKDRKLKVQVAGAEADKAGRNENSDAAPPRISAFHSQPEWCFNIAHPVEVSRGQVGSADVWSPGWFELPLKSGACRSLTVSAEKEDATRDEIEASKHRAIPRAVRDNFPEADSFGRQLVRASRAYVVRRDKGKTVIAGYPWFLDWGRDSLICARGLLSAGMVDEVRKLLITLARFEENGTLPNTIHGDNASNRDTSDAPLWFGVACEELAGIEEGFFETPVGFMRRTIRDVLASIVEHYSKGTPNGIRMDPGSALIWSPTHFTWMDTNYPAGTPREGYPVEIQALWIRLLRLLARIGDRKKRKEWQQLADQALDSVNRLLWLEDKSWFADGLLAGHGKPAREAVVDRSLRGNCLLLISLGLMEGEQARQCVQSAVRHLVIPGALRTLAPLSTDPPLPVYGNDGQLLNNPAEPYWGRYEGDEDTRRKPAYHNGTAWTWPFPNFCEALVRAWNFEPRAVAAAKAYLGGMDALLKSGCLGQLPEVLDGDAPHQQRGCDAQAWGVTEAVRVWRLLQECPA